MGKTGKMLLNSEQMARFVDAGFLRFDGIVPGDICARFLDELKAGKIAEYTPNAEFQTPLSERWHGSVVREILELPAVAGIIASLVGPNPLYDHHAVHVRKAGQFNPGTGGGSLHQDFPIDLRPFTFDINVSLFPHDVTAEMGGTLLVPGSQYRKPLNNDLYRYQNVRGTQQIICPAGTILIWHGKLWHSGRGNRSDKDRVMFKLRLNPTVPQVRLWDTSDLESFNPDPILRHGHPWMGSDHLVEFMHRIRQWRYMTGAHAYDLEGFWNRLSISFGADRADPRYSIPSLDATPRVEIVGQQAAERRKAEPAVL